MGTMFTPDSLERLKQRIDLVEVVSTYRELKRSGAVFKGLCPFHDEKTASFTIQKGDSHYHCFGCGAHGDAIAFLMNYQKFSFVDAICSLAEKFQVPLERSEKTESNDSNKGELKQVLQSVCRFYQSMLLHTDGGHRALAYLRERDIDLPFIYQFSIGFASKDLAPLRAVAHAHNISEEQLIKVGVLTQTANSQRPHQLFSERITFPIHDAQGNVIGFSARKFLEGTGGGKYVNTAETVLFKKSRVLFGLYHSRRQIAKTRQAIIVEGQLDALRLIYSGWPIAVAGQGTAFGEEQVRQLMTLGLNEVFLAFDGDVAGDDAAVKVGHLFQREGVGVWVATLPRDSDPDSFIRRHGCTAFGELLESSQSYVEYLVNRHKKQLASNTPAGKNALATTLAQQIRSWSQPVMVHESLKELAKLLSIPEGMLGIGVDYIPNVHINNNAIAGIHQVDSHRILEADFLRWLLLASDEHPQLVALAKATIAPCDLIVPPCQRLYSCYLDRLAKGLACDLLSLSIALPTQQEQALIAELPEKKINKERADFLFAETIQRLHDRNWMQQREAIKMRIQSGQCSDDEVMELARQFDALKRTMPPPAIYTK